MNRDDDPVENPEKRREARDESKDQRTEQIFPFDGVQQRNQCKPGEKSEVEVWKGKNKENSRNSTEKDIPFFHGSHLKE